MIEFFLPITSELIEFLKKNRKSFGNEFDGSDFKLDSLVLPTKVPNAFSNEIRRKNNKVISFVKKNVSEKLDEINQYIKSKMDSMQNMEKIIQSSEEEDYIKLVDILLENGSLLVMKDTTQTYWMHRLPPTKIIHGPRINLTFRTITNHIF
mgnify:CR=1 FL=1